MKILTLVLLTLGCAFGQAVYIEPPPALTVSGNPPSGSFPTVLAASGARVSLCAYPSCASLTQTYTDATAVTPCPLNMQAVIAGTSTCTNAADVRGNFGFWVLTGGQYQYKITLANGTVYGPYPVTMQTNNAANVQIIDPTSTPRTVQDLASPAAGKGGAIVAYNSYRTVGGKLADQQSVKDFGAAGDNSTDDSPAFQLCANLGVSCYVPPATYKLATQITINAKSSQFIGAGKTSVIHFTGTGAAFYVTGLSIQVSFRELTFSGSSAATNAILVDAAELLTVIEHCFFSGFSGATATDVELRTNNAEINFNYFASGNRAILLKNMGAGFGAQAVNVRGNTFGSLAGYTVEYILSEMPNNRFVGNSFNGGTPIQLHIDGGNGQVVRDNYFEGASQCLIKVENASNHLFETNLLWGIHITPYAFCVTSSVANAYIHNYFDTQFTTATYSLPVTSDPYSFFLSGGSIPTGATPQFGMISGYDSASPGNVMRLRAVVGQTRNLLELQNENGTNIAYATQDGKITAIRGFWSLSGDATVESRNCFGRTGLEQCIVGAATNAGYFGDAAIGDMLFVSYNDNKKFRFGNGNSAASKFTIDTTTGATGAAGTQTAPGFIANAGAPTVAAAQIGYGGTTSSTANIGAAGAPPAQVVGYIIVNIAGTNYKIPYYAN